jgi:beta-N-acetylhexosaminidase
MTFTTAENAHAVLLPAFDHLQLSDTVAAFLDHGGVSLLLGESRAEYLARTMSPERRQRETPEQFQHLTETARARADTLLTAVDQELGGICRLHDLAPAFPTATGLAECSEAQIEAATAATARAAAALGVNAFLAPVADPDTGPNPWLRGRRMAQDPARVGALAAAYVRGVQSAGVAATVKHFPGFAAMTGDPAVERDAENPASLAALQAGYPAFRAPIDAGAAMVMVGPSLVPALDPGFPALRSPAILRLLRTEFGFQGVIMADDLDGAATLRGASLTEVALEALRAGCDFLLMADIGDHLAKVATAITNAADQDAVFAEQLARSAAAVRALARRYSPEAA